MSKFNLIAASLLSALFVGQRACAQEETKQITNDVKWMKGELLWKEGTDGGFAAFVTDQGTEYTIGDSSSSLTKKYISEIRSGAAELSGRFVDKPKPIVTVQFLRKKEEKPVDFLVRVDGHEKWSKAHVLRFIRVCENQFYTADESGISPKGQGFIGHENSPWAARARALQREHLHTIESLCSRALVDLVSRFPPDKITFGTLSETIQKLPGSNGLTKNDPLQETQGLFPKQNPQHPAGKELAKKSSELPKLRQCLDFRLSTLVSVLVDASKKIQMRESDGLDKFDSAIRAANDFSKSSDGKIFDVSENLESLLEEAELFFLSPFDPKDPVLNYYSNEFAKAAKAISDELCMDEGHSIEREKMLDALSERFFKHSFPSGTLERPVYLLCSATGNFPQIQGWYDSVEAHRSKYMGAAINKPDILWVSVSGRQVTTHTNNDDKATFDFSLDSIFTDDEGFHSLENVKIVGLKRVKDRTKTLRINPDTGTVIAQGKKFTCKSDEVYRPTKKPGDYIYEKSWLDNRPKQIVFNMRREEIEERDPAEKPTDYTNLDPEECKSLDARKVLVALKKSLTTKNALEKGYKISAAFEYYKQCWTSDFDAQFNPIEKVPDFLYGMNRYDDLKLPTINRHLLDTFQHIMNSDRCKLSEEENRKRLAARKKIPSFKSLAEEVDFYRNAPKLKKPPEVQARINYERAIKEEGFEPVGERWPNIVARNGYLFYLHDQDPNSVRLPYLLLEDQTGKIFYPDPVDGFAATPPNMSHDVLDFMADLKRRSEQNEEPKDRLRFFCEISNKGLHLETLLKSDIALADAFGLRKDIADRDQVGRDYRKFVSFSHELEFEMGLRKNDEGVMRRVPVATYIDGQLTQMSCDPVSDPSNKEVRASYCYWSTEDYVIKSPGSAAPKMPKLVYGFHLDEFALDIADKKLARIAPSFKLDDHNHLFGRLECRRVSQFPLKYKLVPIRPRN